MNVNNWSGKKKVAAILLVILAIVGIVLTLFLVQRQQELRSRAEKSTTLSLTPASLQATAGEDVSLDVVVNPGNNQVGFVTLDIKYDSTSFTVEDDAFELDASTGFQVISSGQIVAPGEYKVTVSAGSDPTNVIQGAAKKLGTFRMGVNSDAAAGSYNVDIDSTSSIVTSIASNDDLGSVLNQTLGAKIIVGGGICKPNTMTCEWDPAEGATGYHYIITRNDQQNTVLVEDDTTETSVEFTDPEFTVGTSFTYKCAVTSKNDCGEGESAEGESQCARPSETPTPTLTITNTPTPTSVITNTPTPTTAREETPTPTTPEETVETPTPTKVTVVVTQPEVPGGAKGGVEVVNTPTPTIAETGNPVVYGGIIGGIIFVLGGIALLFL